MNFKRALNHTQVACREGCCFAMRTFFPVSVCDFTLYPDTIRNCVRYRPTPFSSKFIDLYVCCDVLPVSLDSPFELRIGVEKFEPQQTSTTINPNRPIGKWPSNPPSTPRWTYGSPLIPHISALSRWERGAVSVKFGNMNHPSPAPVPSLPQFWPCGCSQSSPC